MSNSFQIIFSDDNQDNYPIPMDKPEQISASVMEFFSTKAELVPSIVKIIYPNKLPKTKQHLLGSMKGFLKALNDTKLVESKVDMWESGGFGGALVDLDRWNDEEYKWQRNVNIKNDEDQARYDKLFTLKEEIVAYAKELKSDKVIGTEFNCHFKTIDKRRKALVEAEGDLELAKELIK